MDKLSYKFSNKIKDLMLEIEKIRITEEKVNWNDMRA